MRLSKFRVVILSSVLLTLTMLAAEGMQAQTFTILYSFNLADGSAPEAGLSMDRAGNLYGTASEGGSFQGECSDAGCGTVFELIHRNSSWVFSPLYTFTGSGGETPQARVVFGPDGALYGTTTFGGAQGFGTVFRLAPPAHVCPHVSCPWTETVLHSFTSGTDGMNPQLGDLTFDQAGNIYGTTLMGGSFGYGTVYELLPSNGGWTENVLYSFQGNQDGQNPVAGVIFDNGNIYGTTMRGGTDGSGTVYELSPSNGGWTESIIHSFTMASGAYQPWGGLILDSSGNLYGTTYLGASGGGTAYELRPSNGSWTFSILYGFTGAQGSFASLAMDGAGDLYGTLAAASIEVFRLTPSGGQWTLTGFTGNAGQGPFGSVVFDANGNLYTTASLGGTHGDGVVFEITP